MRLRGLGMKYKLGDLIELSENVNSALKYKAKDVKGMTITKQVIPTKANVKSTDLSKFYIVEPEEFIYNPRTHGKKIGLGFNDTDKPFLISWNNIAFNVIDKNIVLPTYLYINFCRDEWDRQACFDSWGSSTEVFAWKDLCSMEIDLPPIDIQKKYVAVYKAMLANQQAYEQGLDELKLACDIAVEKIKKNSELIKVDELVEEIDNRNIGGKIMNLQGINISKTFMPSLAKINEGNIEKYKVVKNNEFAYSAMQTGRDECIRIALYNENEPCIVSPAYSVLGVKSPKILPEYFMKWFSRKESDRLGAFISDSSVRASLELSEFFQIEIPVPDLDIQKSIVDIYKVYLERKAISEKLKEQIKNICPVLIKGATDEAKKLKTAS